jgi:DNA (cytosine-5)-methyltransferase 1
VAGFPCQAFSAIGLLRGFKDKRGKVFYGCADYIDSKRPRAFILENVKRLLTHDDKKTFSHIMNCLRNIGKGAYNVEYQILNTCEHGVPQSRARVYIVGIRKDCISKDRPFSFPQPLPKVSISSCLDRPGRRPSLKDAPPKSSSTAHSNVKRVMKKLTAMKKKPLKNTYLIDCDSTPKFLTVMHDQVMCMTKSRGGGHWISSRGRRMNLNEMLRCQGMTRCFKQVVSDQKLGGQIGNAMSQNIIERLLVRLLPSAGLVPKGTRVPDRWVRIAKRSKRRVESHSVSSPLKRSKS